ncbi:MAG: DUF2993 domain-containing protein [Hormoscilla sp. SP5CHS1]|nr:DUF2993 domain-containing protein [Hormoscilla sp. SP5CHS1]
MEFLRIFLSGLLLLVSPAGLIADRAIAKSIRAQVDRVEELQMRVDNAPTHRLLQGKAERVRIAGRGVWLKPEVRIAVLELETDPIDIDRKQLIQSREQPLQGGVRLVLTEADINRALRSPPIAALLRQFSINSLPGAAADQMESYKFVNPRVEFLDNNRLRFQLELQQQRNGNDRGFKLAILAESGFQVVAGRRIELVAPRLEANGNPVPPILVNAIAAGVSRGGYPRRLEANQILIRLLKLEVSPELLEIAAFVALQPPASLPGR